MAMTKCKECGTDISTTADACPKCGAKQIRTSGCAKAVLAVVVLFVLATIVGQCTRKDPTGNSLPPAERPPATPTPAVAAIIDVPSIARKSQKEVAALLGEPTSCETMKQGKKCYYKPGETEVVFISGNADWITINALDSAPFSEDILPLLGIEKTPATFSNANVMRWKTVPGLLEVSIFPAQTGVDYAYIMTATTP